MVNKVILVGRVGKDPDVRHFEGGGMLVTFPLATTETYKKKDGERVENTEWHNIKVSRPGIREMIEKNVEKGQLVYVEGSIKTRSWEKDGVKHYATEIDLDQFRFLSSKNQSSGSASAAERPGQPSPEAPKDAFQDQEDDLPF